MAVFVSLLYCVTFW